MSFRISLTTASPFEPAAAGARRRMDSWADPAFMPGESIGAPAPDRGDSDGVRRLTAGGSWAIVFNVVGRRLIFRCARSAWVFHRGRNIGEAQVLQRHGNRYLSRTLHDSYDSQSSTRNEEIRPNSRVLCVTSVKPC
jgi:hypothetical protein